MEPTAYDLIGEFLEQERIRIRQEISKVALSELLEEAKSVNKQFDV